MRFLTLLTMALVVAAVSVSLVSFFDGAERGLTSIVEAGGGITLSVADGSSGSPNVEVAPGGKSW